MKETTAVGVDYIATKKGVVATCLLCLCLRQEASDPDVTATNASDESRQFKFNIVWWFLISNWSNMLRRAEIKLRR